jgi:diguanylate cyclase (GGDEF)-like protein
VEIQDSTLFLLREDVGESYEAVVRSAAAAVGAATCTLALYDAETDEIVARRSSYAAVERTVPQFRFPLASSPSSAHVVRTGQPYLSSDPVKDSLYPSLVGEEGVRSILTVPVRRGRAIQGLLYALNKPGGFSETDVKTLTALAAAAAVTLENIRLYAEERERRLLNEGLSEVSRALLTTPTEDAGLASVLDQVWRVVRYQAAVAALLEGDTLRVAASRGGDTGLTLPLAEAGPLRQALQARHATVLADAGPVLAAFGLEGPRGPVLVAPLVARGSALGAFLVVLEPERAPEQKDIQLVEAFADHAALFLEAGGILRRERQARARASALARITRLAATRHEPDSLLQAVAPELLSLSGADRVALYLRHPRTLVLIPVADAGAMGEEEERVRELRLDMSASPLDALQERPRPLAFHEASNPPPSSITPFPDTRALLVVPMLSRGEVVGAALVAQVGQARGFEPALVGFLDDVVQQVAMGVENARLFARLAQMASTDELTRLANRRRFTEGIRVELARSRRTGAPLALVMADIDHLKRVNDTYGHPGGDAAIRHVADTLRHGRRETDLAARLGGEEFALLMPGTDLVGAIKAAERVRAALEGSTVPMVGQVTASIGVACCPEDGQTEEDLIRVADERLYAAKSGGRNRVCYMTLPGGVAMAEPVLPPERLA